MDEETIDETVVTEGETQQDITTIMTTTMNGVSTQDNVNVIEEDGVTLEHTNDTATKGDNIGTASSVHALSGQCDCACVSCSIYVTDILHLQLPPKMKRRGRPKGSELTTIGLPKKKKRSDGKPVAFIKKHPKEKERGNYNYIYNRTAGCYIVATTMAVVILLCMFIQSCWSGL